ncbi:MAG: response regulator [Leptospiraceae bacterium]|nr:response regulator [Leptospiraceae bacterium]MCP5512796.1 response regulator [Leptospiraceae bacterium]
MEKILIVDDNDRYAKNLEIYFQNKNIPTERAFSAGEGYKKYQSGEFTAIISDITMETQISGLQFVRKVFKEGYPGKIIIATTGFDAPGVMGLGKFLLPIYAGITWMIPKVPLKRGEVIFFPTTLAGEKQPFL